MRLDLTGLDVAAFWATYAPPDARGCRVWTGETNPNGYGRVRINGRRIAAHRIAYLLTHGEIPDDRPCVCHTCDNPPCGEPAHLIAETNLWNTRDSVRKGRRATGDRNGSRKYPELLKRGDEHPARVHGDAYFARGDQHPARTNPDYLARGSRHGNAKLTEEIVRKARERYAAGGVSYEALAIEAGVSLHTMWNAVRGATWKHL